MEKLFMKELWKKVLLNLQRDFPQDYDLWFIQLDYDDYSKKSHKVTLKVSNRTILNIIEDKFQRTLEEYFNAVAPEVIKVDIIVGESSIFNDVPSENSSKTEKPSKTSRASYHSKELNNLNAKFNFDRFVCGSNTDLAYKAAQLIAKDEEGNFDRFNPFFIYGGVGLGKTHLIQAIGNYIIKNNPHLKVIYVTAEKYLNDYIEANITRNFQSFRNYYREANILLMDDVQFLENKEKIQDEIFNNFNNLYQQNRQIIFTCDKHPKDLKNVQERLISRFSWGLTVDIKPPDLETRRSILERKIKEKEIFSSVTKEIIDFLAENITDNIRDIESAVTKIHSLILLTEKNITLELLEAELADLLTPAKAKNMNVSALEIQKIVAEYYHLSIADLKSKSRAQHIVFPRHMAIYICKQILNQSLSKIGEEFGNRDHSTIVSCIKKIELDINKFSSSRNDYEEILKRITTK